MKSKILKRLTAMLLACILCVSGSVVAFAAEVERSTGITVEKATNEASPTSTGDLIAISSQYLSTGSGTFTLTLDSGNWSADFTVSINGNSSGKYQITMTHNGKTYDLGIVYGNGLGTDLYTLTYASSGTYTFTVTNTNNSTAGVTAIAQVYD